MGAAGKAFVHDEYARNECGCESSMNRGSAWPHPQSLDAQEAGRGARQSVGLAVIKPHCVVIEAEVRCFNALAGGHK